MRACLGIPVFGGGGWVVGGAVVGGAVVGWVVGGAVVGGGVVAVAMPIIHLNGHFPPDFATSDGAFRFVWILYALGTLGSLTVIVALRELLSGRQARGGPPAGDT